MKTVSSFLPDNSKLKKDNRWYNNSKWNERIVKNSGLVSILPLENFSERIKNCFVSYDSQFIDYSVIVQYYEWYRGSYIPWHSDITYCFGATIYLNKEWDSEDGGLFFYIENGKTLEELKCIYPSYNKLIINNLDERHHVSLVNYHSKEIRKTLQIWMVHNDKLKSKENNNKINYF